MSRRLIVVLAVACGASPAGRALRPGERPAQPAIALAAGRALARGVLAYDVAVDGAGHRVAWVELSTEFALVVHDLAANRQLARVVLGPPDWDVVDVDLDASGRWAAVASLDGAVRVFDAGTGAPAASWRLDAAATALAFSPDGKWLATGAASGALCLRRGDDGTLVECVPAHEGRVASVAFAPGGEALASAGWDGRAIVWEAPSLAELARAEPGGAVNALAFAPDGHALALVTSGTPPVRTPELDEAERAGRARSLDSAAAVLVWPWSEPGTAPRKAGDHAFKPVAVAWTPDGRRLLTGAWDRSVRLWDPAGGEVARAGGFAHIVRAVAVSPDARWAVVASWAGEDFSARAVTMVELRYP